MGKTDSMVHSGSFRRGKFLRIRTAGFFAGGD